MVLKPQDMSAQGLKEATYENLHYNLAKDPSTTTAHDKYLALAVAIRDRLVERWINTQQQYHTQNNKRVYYLSMEFLIGKLLAGNILNLDLWDEAKQVSHDLGIDLEKLFEEEPDAGLGNGGLGRLAACFLDSLATLGIPAHGYGIRYEYGIFHQKLVDGHQMEAPDEWLKRVNPWEFERPEYAVTVRFYGKTRHTKGPDGNMQVEWYDTDNVVAMPYDTPIPGYQNDTVNTLRLWSARSSEEFDLQYFNDGDYEHAVYHKMYSENISKVLYPNDANALGRELRLKQEYFFTAASVSDIMRRFKVDNKDLKEIPDKVAIQLNDTHPALAVVEFMRVLIDEEGLDWKTSWAITQKVFAYTNHTLMPEALETWSVPLFGRLLPRHLELVYEINHRFLEEVKKKFKKDEAFMGRVSLVQESDPKRIRMAYLAIVGSHSVNGVSALHSDLITETLFKNFYELYPEKFNNKTNGVTPRQWLLKANPGLSKLVTQSIGDKWVTDLSQLKKLEKYATDHNFQEKWQEIKKENKKKLAKIIFNSAGFRVNENSLFDVQVKRIHEYKRQVLFAFYMLSEYIKIQEGKTPTVPRTFLVAGKAAPGYTMAKLIIKFINNIAYVINRDPKTRDLIRIAFLENYRVSLAEKIFPASDLSEQVSTAGTEASGTGNMKFMLNGALTIGTLDGANIEMVEEGGIENFFIFGLKAGEVQDLKQKGYRPQDFIERSPVLAEIFRLIETDFFSKKEPGIFKPLLESLLTNDPYLVCADFEDYCQVQEQVSKLYQDPSKWTEKAILNVASAGKFSSDRTIQEYATHIWKVE